MQGKTHTSCQQIKTEKKKKNQSLISLSLVNTQNPPNYMANCLLLDFIEIQAFNFMKNSKVP